MEKMTGRDLIFIRQPDSFFQARGIIENGTFEGKWHFSFDQYHDRDYSHFGTLRAFNDDTLSPGASFPLHPHRNIELVTYCAAGLFRHADEHGGGNFLRKGWVQHTTAGRGVSHAEINDSKSDSMRFIQMWFLPSELNLEPALQQRPVEQSDRKNRLLLLVSGGAAEEGVLPIASDALVYSSYLENGRSMAHELDTGRGAYLFVVEGGSVRVNGHSLTAMSAAKIIGGQNLRIKAEANVELLLVEIPLAVGDRYGL